MAAGSRIFVDADKNIFWWLKKRGTTHLFTNKILFSQTLPEKIDRLVWHITLPCVAKNHTTQQNRTYQPTYTPTICTRFIIFPLNGALATQAKMLDQTT